MRSLLIRGGRVIDPARRMNEIGNLFISNGKVLWIDSVEATPSHRYYDVLDAKGMVVCPGFIDLHCHLRQPGYEDKETIATGTAAAAKGGFTTVCCMPNTNPSLDNPATIDFVKSVAESEGVVRVLPIGCITKGRKGEELADLKALASAGVVGFSDDGSPVINSDLMRLAMEQSRALGLPIIDHCEASPLTRGGVMNEGAISARLGLRGMPAAAEEIMVARDLMLAEQTGAHIHIAHVSVEGSVELIRQAKDRGKRVKATAEVTPHHLTLTDEEVIKHGTNAKVNPPLRTKRDTEVLIRGLRENLIDAIATDHAPHTQADKSGDITEADFGMSGFETALGTLMSLVHTRQLRLCVLISRLTCEPAKIIGDKYGKLGTITVDTPADVTVFDPNMSWVVDPASFVSKGKNTPLAGATLKGKVMATIYQGNLVYKDDSIKFGMPGEQITTGVKEGLRPS